MSDYPTRVDALGKAWREGVRASTGRPAGSDDGQRGGRVTRFQRQMWWATSVIPLAEALRIAVLEATVHLLDLVRALDREPILPDVALRETALLLAEMAPAIEFVESATGRTPAARPLPVIR